MKRRFLVVLSCDDGEEADVELPIEMEVAEALEHSTAAEALAEALGCTTTLTLIALENI